MAPPSATPLAFIDEYGQPNLDTAAADVGTHFILTAILVEAGAVDSVRSQVDAVRVQYCQKGELRVKRLASNVSRFRRVLEALDPVPFTFYAVVVDKREIDPGSGLAYKESFTKFLSSLPYRKLFGSFPNLEAIADAGGSEQFMEGFARYLQANHRQTLFDRPRVTFIDSRTEPLVSPRGRTS